MVKLMDGINIGGVLADLDAAPDIWGVHPERVHDNGPHAGCQDVWLRYRAKDRLLCGQDYLDPHWAEFYPAWWRLPSLRPVVFWIAGLMEATYLGGMLITRIPPGGQVKPHVDGGWHALTMNCKVYLPLRANDGCINRCGDEAAVMRPGELWTFCNQVVHSVENNGDTPRETLIVSMKTEHETIR
tara:strand:- start:4471 stop:5025 length:555 start_codon:yes stop_codon:yes gene_type:complete